MKALVLFLILIVAVITDYRRHKIYNWLTLPGMLAGLAWNLAAAGGGGVADALAGLLLGIGFFFPLWIMKKFSAGDAKLCGVVGAFGGLRFSFWAIAFTLAAGAVIALIILARRGMLKATLDRLACGLLTRSLETGNLETAPADQRYPYSAAILIGSLLAQGAITNQIIRLPF